MAPGLPSTALVSLTHTSRADTDPLHVVKGVSKVKLEARLQGRSRGPCDKTQPEAQARKSVAGSNFKLQGLDSRDDLVFTGYPLLWTWQTTSGVATRRMRTSPPVLVA